jgi:hypothetical protein
MVRMIDDDDDVDDNNNESPLWAKASNKLWTLTLNFEYDDDDRRQRLLPRVSEYCSCYHCTFCQLKNSSLFITNWTFLCIFLWWYFGLLFCYFFHASCDERFKQQTTVFQQALGQLKAFGQRVTFATSRMEVLRCESICNEPILS